VISTPLDQPMAALDQPMAALDQPMAALDQLTTPPDLPER
jgi:hypothetical protein